MTETITVQTREPAANPRQPRLAVLLPLGDSRMDAVDNIATWTKSQTCDSLDFEIVAVADGSDPEMEQAIAQILRPHDKVVTCPPTEHVLARLARAATYADADLLLFAEHHCTAQSNCADATIRFFQERPDAVAGVLEMKQRPGTAHGSLDQRWFAEVEEYRVLCQSWAKLQTGAFAMRKDCYFALGAHDGRYGLFADEILTTKAHHAGLVVGQIADSSVTHITATMRDHQHHVEDYTRGECAFRATQDIAFCERYFGYDHVWANRQAFDPGLARSTAAILSRVLARDLCLVRGKDAIHGLVNLSHELARRLLFGMLGPRWALAFAHAMTRWSELRATHLSRGQSSGWDHFQRAWQRMIHFARLSCAIEHHTIPSTIPMTPEHWPICDIPETQRVGFHGLEYLENVAFRWSEPVMMVRIALPPGRIWVDVVTPPLRAGTSDFVRGVFWNGRRISAVEIDDRRIRFPLEIASPQPQWLSIVANPLNAPSDCRRLGIPVSALSFSPQ
jgi:hypothetical protein